jgi:uncharacterized protein involved in exopolysaccharide biosynthesis
MRISGSCQERGVTPTKPSFGEHAGEIGLAGIWRLLWRYKLLVGLTCLISGIGAVILALIATPIYRAEVVATSTRNRGMGNADSFSNQLGGIASLVGIGLTAADGGASQEAAAVLDSRHLAEEFIKRNGLLPELLRNVKRRPSLWWAVKAFREGVLTVRKDQRKGLTTVAIEWTDPATAARWANGYVALANELIRARALDDANRNIKYLNDQIARTNVVELRKIMYDIIENETKNLMLANGRIEYAFEVVDPAVPPEFKVRPHRTLIVLVGLALGLLVATAAAFILEWSLWRRGTAAQSERRHSGDLSAQG